MKIAVSAQGQGLDAQVDPRFGRAQSFVVVDIEAGTSASVDNTPNLEAAQGAGIQAGRKIVELGADVVLTGHVGPKAFATLSAGAVRVFTGASGRVADAIKQFKTGRLSSADAPDVEGHWV